jgi:hypothetical protein
VDSIVISDEFRVPVTAQRLKDGRIIIRTPGKGVMLFSAAEVDRLAKFASGAGTMQRYPMGRTV